MKHDATTSLHQRLATLGADRLGDVVLDIDAATLSAWLGLRDDLAVRPSEESKSSAPELHDD